MGEVELKGEGGSKEWKERRKEGRREDRVKKREERGRGRGDEMVKGKEGWSGRKLGIGRRERWRGKGLREGRTECKRLCCM